MSNDKVPYESFINEVNPAYREFVNQTHDFFLKDACKFKIELAKSGYVVSYSDAKTKKVVTNFVFRKGALIIRIYADNINKYGELLDRLPAGMIKSIEKAPVCKRLIDPAKCNSRCAMGYDFTIKDNRFQKCRFSSFMFEVNEENIPFIKVFIENEMKERTAV